MSEEMTLFLFRWNYTEFFFLEKCENTRSGYLFCINRSTRKSNFISYGLGLGSEEVQKFKAGEVTPENSLVLKALYEKTTQYDIDDVSTAYPPEELKKIARKKKIKLSAPKEGRELVSMMVARGMVFDHLDPR